jgi:excisionase family DNA binding protein
MTATHALLGVILFLISLTNYWLVRIHMVLTSKPEIVPQKDTNGRAAMLTYSIGEAAAYLGVSIESIRRWTDEDQMECLRSPGNHRRFTREMLERFMGATT